MLFRSASYSLEEPRYGLSARVLVRVQSDSTGSRKGRRILLMATAAALACVVIAIAIWRTGARLQPAPRVARVVEEKPRVVAKSPELVPEISSAKRIERRHFTRRLPRRNSFPSSEPLSAQERALVAFARQAPAVALQLSQPDKPLELPAIDIEPIEIDGLSTGENK